MATPDQAPHTHIIENFQKLDTAMKAVLFARIVNGSMGARDAVHSNQEVLENAQSWLPEYFQRTTAGWLMRQRSPQLEKKGEKAVLSKLPPLAVARHVDARSDSAEVGNELSTSQFMALLVLGMLSKLKSVNYTMLHKEQALGGDNVVARELSFWEFNWQPETVFGQLKWLEGTGHWVVNTPEDLVTKHPHQFLRFGHFVSSMTVVSQDRAAEMKRVFNRKQTKSETSNQSALNVLIPDGLTIKVKPEDEIEDNPFTYNGTVPKSFLDLIEGLKL